MLPLLLSAVAGQMRLATANAEMVPGVKIRIVQPSVPQREKWRPENQARIFQDHLDLSATAPGGAPGDFGGATHVVWPEAAMPFLPLDHAGARAAIGRLLPAGTFLITGALRAEPTTAAARRRPRRVFNSLLVFGEGGSLTTYYDKIHLVPFGEYLPFQTRARSDRPAAAGAHARRLRQRGHAAAVAARAAVAAARTADLL